MGRRSSKSSPAQGAALPFDTVGMTILPGRSLPAWAEPVDEVAQWPEPELIADSPTGAVDSSAASAQDVVSAADAPPSPRRRHSRPGRPPLARLSLPPPRLPLPRPAAAMSREPAFAMAGAALVGAGVVAGPAQSGPPESGHHPEPSRYPAAPTAGLGAMSAAQYSAPTLTAPTAEHVGAGALATATYASGTDTRTATEPAGSHDPGQSTLVESPAPDAPSAGWKSPERPELSPEHVALLSWWADMIAAGQFPAPAAAGAPGTQASAPAKPRRSFPMKAAALAVIAVAAVGAAAVVAPKVLASDEPMVVPVTEVTMPATVGGLVAITDPAIGAELQNLLGFGLRPAGVTVTGAYGTTPDAPLAMAAMATTVGAPAEAVGQIATWTADTGATVAPSVAGTGANEGITCAAVEAIPDAQPGSFCVWTASGKRGQTYSVAMSVEDALALTNQLRSSITGATPAA